MVLALALFLVEMVIRDPRCASGGLLLRARTGKLRQAAVAFNSITTVTPGVDDGRRRAAVNGKVAISKDGTGTVLELRAWRQVWRRQRTCGDAGLGEQSRAALPGKQADVRSAGGGEGTRAAWGVGRIRPNQTSAVAVCMSRADAALDLVALAVDAQILNQQPAAAAASCSGTHRDARRRPAPRLLWSGASPVERRSSCWARMLARSGMREAAPRSLSASRTPAPCDPGANLHPGRRFGWALRGGPAAWRAWSAACPRELESSAPRPSQRGHHNDHPEAALASRAGSRRDTVRTARDSRLTHPFLHGKRPFVACQKPPGSTVTPA